MNVFMYSTWRVGVSTHMHGGGLVNSCTSQITYTLTNKHAFIYRQALANAGPTDTPIHMQRYKYTHVHTERKTQLITRTQVYKRTHTYTHTKAAP